MFWLFSKCFIKKVDHSIALIGFPECIKVFSYGSIWHTLYIVLISTTSQILLYIEHFPNMFYEKIYSKIWIIIMHWLDFQNVVRFVLRSFYEEVFHIKSWNIVQVSTFRWDHKHLVYYFILYFFKKYSLINMDHKIALIEFREYVKICVYVFSCRNIWH